MKLLLAKSAGFCFGVRRAVEKVEDLLRAEAPCRIYTLGELIHNSLYLKELEGKGVFAIDEKEAARVAAESDEAGKSFLLLRTHGVSRRTEEAIRALTLSHPNFFVIDLTCPFVKRIHRLAETETDENGIFLLFGQKGHPEVEGTLDRAPCPTVVFDRADELYALCEEFSPDTPLCMAAQTTESKKEFEKSKKILEKLYTNPKIFDTICNVTEDRQSEAVTLSEVADAVIVIGGKNSSNSRKLYELCASICGNTQFIESAKDLTKDFSPDATVAITAGASTPDGLIMEVYKEMDEIRSENFAEMLEGTLKTLNTGETVTGIVTSIAKDAVYVDVGVKGTGIVKRDQITDDTDADLAKMFKVGDELMLFVIRVNDGEGIITLSKKRVDRDKNWYDLVAMKDEGGIIEGPVTETNKGGVVIEYMGNKVFVPASRTGVAKDGDLSVLLGTTQRARIIEIDEHKKRAVASIRSVQIEEEKEREAAIWATLEVGKHYTGTVKNLTSYGAFVDIGGIDGMVHNTELSWKHIKSPKEVVSVGDTLDVYIKDLDVEKKRISLGYKTADSNPWTKFSAEYKVGDIVKAKIVSMMPFGAFAEVIDGVDGLIHISRISQEKIARPQDVLTIGQEVDVKIVEIDNERNRLSLSMRAILDDAQRAEEEAARAAEKAARDAEREAAAKERAELEAEMAPYIVRSID